MSFVPEIRRSVVERLRLAGCIAAEEEADVLFRTARTPDELISLVDRRLEGPPVEHVVGWTEFCGFRIEVDNGVFVPRPRTEELACRAVDVIQPGDTVLDLCCGSGAIGVTVARSIANVTLHAVDIDEAAVQCARRNLESWGGRVYHGNLYEPLPVELKGTVDVIVANAPYVPTDEIANLPREARLYEPSIALDGGRDGLDVLRMIARGAPEWLTTNGRVLVEASTHQAPSAIALFNSSGVDAEIIADCP